MKNLGTKIVFYVIVTPISLLPLNILFLFSDFLFFIIYYIVGYRKKVVLTNIQNSFPSKSEEECIAISKKFYHHFCDLIVENIKGITASKKQLTKRITIPSLEPISSLLKNKKNFILVGGHYNNWEVQSLTSLIEGYHTIGIYKALSNKYLDEKLLQIRGKFGMIMCPMAQTPRFFMKDMEKPKIVSFVADQRPGDPKQAHWMQFLNQDTPVFMGIEKLAKRYNYPVVFLSIQKTKRGFYELHYRVIIDNPQDTKLGEITEAHTKALEKDIEREPQYWLWSHKRWKHKRN